MNRRKKRPGNIDITLDPILFVMRVEATRQIRMKNS
jgi:hypothetical protein